MRCPELPTAKMGPVRRPMAHDFWWATASASHFPLLSLAAASIGIRLAAHPPFSRRQHSTTAFGTASGHCHAPARGPVCARRPPSDRILVVGALRRHGAEPLVVRAKGRVMRVPGGAAYHRLLPRSATPFPQAGSGSGAPVDARSGSCWGLWRSLGFVGHPPGLGQRMESPASHFTRPRPCLCQGQGGWQLQLPKAAARH